MYTPTVIVLLVIRRRDVKLFIIAEHDFRVEHCLLAPEGMRKENVKRVMSHPQALAQCDNYLRELGMEKVPTYDTAGSAKMISENNLEGCAAIASDLAAEAWGMDVLASNIEDDDMNYTRFLLLARQPVRVHLSPDLPSKTSVVFTLPNSAGALYKALACFSLREIDCSKIESRPTSAQLLQYLRFQQTTHRAPTASRTHDAHPNNELPRFQYCFHLDFLAAELDDHAQSALAHLQELTPFMRVLGSYPRDSKLVGPVCDTLEALARSSNMTDGTLTADPPREMEHRSGHASERLKIGIIGFGNFGQFIAKTFVQHHDVVSMGRGDHTKAAKEMGVTFYPQFESTEFFVNDFDVVLFAVSVLSFEEVLKSIPASFLSGKLVVDVLSVKMHAKDTMLKNLPPDADILCTHPMFGPESGARGWAGLPFVYDRVRTSNYKRLGNFLSIWESQRCKMVEMTCEQHDKYAANTQFITHLMGRILSKQGLSRTPVDTQGFASVLRLIETTCSDSFDLFYGLFRFNPHSHDQLRRLRESLAEVERQLAAKEAYVAAKAEVVDEDRRRILAEFRTIIQEAAKNAAEAATEKVLTATASGGADTAMSEKASPLSSAAAAAADVMSDVEGVTKKRTGNDSTDERSSLAKPARR